MAEIASAYVSLLPSAKGFGSKLNSQVGGEVTSSGKKLGSSFGKMFVAGAAALGGAAAIGGFLKDSISEAREAQKVGALTESTIKATGGAAHVTAQQVGDLAGALSSKTGIDDEVIQSGQNMLLTFKNIRNEAGAGNDIFNQSTKTLVDLSAAMGTEPKQAAIQLGKALNDPIKGVSALTRVGVTFTDGQKKQIETLVKSGDTLKAQKIILGELNSEFGGAAEAQATAGEKAAVAFGNLKEQIGTALLPIIDRLANTLTTTIIPAISGFIAQMQDGTGAGGRLASILETVWTVVSAVFGFVISNKDAVGAFVSILATAAAVTKTWTAAQILLNVAMTANPIGIVVVAIAALVAGVIYAYKHFDTFRAVVDATFSFLKSAVTTVIGFVKDHWKLILGILLGPIAAAAIAIATHWSDIKETFSRGVAAVVGFLRSLPGKAKAALAPLGAAVGGVFTATFAKVSGIVEGGAERVMDVVRSIPGKIRALGSLFAAAGHDIINAFVNGLRGASGLVSDIAGNVWDAVRGMLNSAIAKINAALSFTIHLPGPDINVNPPDIPMLAKGGPVSAGRPYIVGEEGPELYVPTHSGRIIPNHKLRSSGGLGGDDAVLAELRAMRKALARVGADLGHEINGAASAGHRRRVA